MSNKEKTRKNFRNNYLDYNIWAQHLVFYQGSSFKIFGFLNCWHRTRVYDKSSERLIIVSPTLKNNVDLDWIYLRRSSEATNYGKNRFATSSMTR